MLDLYVHKQTTFKLTDKYQPQRLDNALSKYSKQSRSVQEIQDQLNQLSKYLKSQLKETIAERAKLMP